MRNFWRKGYRLLHITGWVVNALTLSPKSILITVITKHRQLLEDFVPQTTTGALPLDPTGGLPSSRSTILDPPASKARLRSCPTVPTWNKWREKRSGTGYPAEKRPLKRGWWRCKNKSVRLSSINVLVIGGQTERRSVFGGDNFSKSLSLDGEYCKYSMGQKNGLHAFGYNSRRKWTDLDEIWNIVSQMLGTGPGRFWARSAQ